VLDCLDAATDVAVAAAADVAVAVCVEPGAFLGDVKTWIFPGDHKSGKKRERSLPEGTSEVKQGWALGALDRT